MSLTRAPFEAALAAIRQRLLRRAHPGGRVRLGRMMRRLGVDFGALARRPVYAESLAEAARLCVKCLHSERCEQWLAHPCGASVPEFCPLRRRLAALPGVAASPSGNTAGGA